MTEQDEPIKSYFPIPKPLAEMTKEERRQFATEFAEFALENANQLTPPGLNDGAINEVSGEIDSQSRLKKAVAKARDLGMHDLKNDLVKKWAQCGAARTQNPLYRGGYSGSASNGLQRLGRRSCRAKRP